MKKYYGVCIYGVICKNNNNWNEWETDNPKCGLSGHSYHQHQPLSLLPQNNDLHEKSHLSLHLYVTIKFKKHFNKFNIIYIYIVIMYIYIHVLLSNTAHNLIHKYKSHLPLYIPIYHLSHPCFIVVCCWPKQKQNCFSFVNTIPSSCWCTILALM